MHRKCLLIFDLEYPSVAGREIEYEKDSSEDKA